MSKSASIGNMKRVPSLEHCPMEHLKKVYQGKKESTHRHSKKNTHTISCNVIYGFQLRRSPSNHSVKSNN